MPPVSDSLLGNAQKMRVDLFVDIATDIADRASNRAEWRCVMDLEIIETSSDLRALSSFVAIA
jgi:hypothetical protein